MNARTTGRARARTRGALLLLAAAALGRVAAATAQEASASKSTPGAEPALATLQASAQATPATRPIGAIIDEYVARGLEANLGLRAVTLDIERSQAALDAARAQFFPSLSFDARYTRNEGGAAIALPVASALNPVYATLNDLLAASGRARAFPQIEDPAFTLLQPRDQDTRLSVRQALFAPAIPAAVRAQSAQLSGSQFARIAFARRLRRDITVGYLGWLQAGKAVAIFESSRGLLAENLRVNESLFRNGRITQDQVLRARAELLTVEQQARTARSASTQARSYLNFLLDRPLDTGLEAAEPDAEVSGTRADLATLRSAALANRPELEQLQSAQQAAAAQVDVAKAARWPTLSLGVDGGIQGPSYDFGSGRNFASLSLLLDWKLFDGGRRSADVHAARAGEARVRTQRDELAQSIQLEVEQALDRLTTSADSLATADARAAAARAGFRIASRKRDEGAISQVEFIDARNALTSAELNLNATRFELLAREADLDYVTAAGHLPLPAPSTLP